MQTLAPAAAAVLLTLSLAGPAAAYPAATAADCAFYETVYEAVAPRLDEARYGSRASVFATVALARAHPPGRGMRAALPGRPGPVVDLAACRALVGRIEASGAPVRFSRPPLLRQVDGPYIEYFSRPTEREGKTHVTYYLGRDAGVDVRLSRRAGGAWVVEAAETWETIIIT